MEEKISSMARLVQLCQSITDRCEISFKSSNGELLQRIEILEKKLLNGNYSNNNSSVNMDQLFSNYMKNREVEAPKSSNSEIDKSVLESQSAVFFLCNNELTLEN